jgi:RNA-directed DNA polymerase
VEQFLKERGLELSPEKTRITQVEDGFDFLGQTLKRQSNGKVLIKPSKRSVKTFMTKIQESIDSSGNKTAGDLIWRLNQQLKGWTMYHRFVVSRRTFAAVDNRIYWKLRRWCRKRHRNKSWKWIKKKYFQPAGDRSGVFSGVIRDSKGKSWPIQLMAAKGVKTLRWLKIRSEANPYDPTWELYLEERAVWKLGHILAGRNRIGYLWKEQGGKCALCGQRLQEEDQPWHRHHRVWRCHGGQDTFDNLELLHANCHRQLHAGKRR